MLIPTYIKKATPFFLLFLVACWLQACKPQEEIFTTDASATLRFSEDAIIFDTVFTDIRTVTKRLTVYNPNKNAVRISEAYIGGQESSPYKVILNGDEGLNFRDVTLLGGDSLLVLVSAKITPSPDDISLAFDSLVFNTNGQLQNVKLVSWGQNVNVIRNDIACNTTWTSNRPYLLYDSVLVAENCVLTIEDSTQIFAFNDAVLHVKGQIKANGTPEGRINFRGFRQEPEYEDVLGQWQGIIFYEESQNNELYNVSIRNADFGIVADKASMVIDGAVIQNMTVGGVIAFGSEIIMTNSIINNCIERLFQATEGGNYQLAHCTLANYEFFISREDDAAGLVFANLEEGVTMEVSLFNNIFWGNLQDEILLGGELNILMLNNIIKSQARDESFFNEIGSANRVNVVADSLFTNPFEANFTLPSTSPALNSGVVTSVVKDLLGNDRDGSPDIGAYERQP